MMTLWLLFGGTVGVLNALLLWRSVARLGLGPLPFALTRMLLAGLLRWGLVAGALVIALRHGAGPGLLAFLGLMVAHWTTVYLTAKTALGNSLPTGEERE